MPFSFPPRLWLDLLTPEIQLRIATHLSHQSSPMEALPLAETSPALRLAVITSLANDLHLDPSNPQNSRWVSLVRDSLTSLTFQTIFPQNSCPSPYPIQLIDLLQSSTLRRVEIDDEVLVLESLEKSSSVRHVSLRLEGKAPADVLARTLSALKLETLELQCFSLSKPNRCPISELYNKCYFLKKSVPTWCISLKSLRVQCHEPRHTDFLWSFMDLFPNLEEVTIAACARGQHYDHLTFLNRMSSVKLVNARKALELAPALGSRVTQLHMSTNILGDRQLELLGACTAIKDLAIVVMEGTERSLAALIKKLERLEILEVRWERKPSPIRIRLFEMRSAMDERLFLDALKGKGASKIRALKLFDVRISGDGIQEIIKHIGSRLQVFHVSISGQDESSLYRLGRVLKALIEFCPELRRFDVRDEMRTIRHEPNQDISKTGRWILVLLRNLYQRAPYLNAGSFESAVKEMIDRDCQNPAPFVTPINSQDIDPQFIRAHLSQSSEMEVDNNQ